MVYGANGGMRFEIGRTDIMDRSYGELTGQGNFKNNDCPWYRLPIGALELQPFGAQSNNEAPNGTLENDIWNAEIRGTLGDESALQFRVVTHTTHEAILIEWETDAQHIEYSTEYSMGFRPDFSAPLSFRYGVAVDQHTLNPPPIFHADGSRFFCTQQTLNDQNYVTAYEIIELAPHRFRLILTVQRGETEAAARCNASQILDDVSSRDWDEMLEEHHAWWRNFWDQSHIALANDESSTRLEAFWYQQNYKFACATRADRPMYDLLGPWTYNTVWSACWWNLNTQLLYLPLYTANRNECFAHSQDSSVSGTIPKMRISIFV